MSLIIGLFFAFLVGVTLGVVGSGGSILTVPILITVFGILPQSAFLYSLFIVGITAMIGTIRGISEKNIDFKTGISFGLTSIITVYFTRIYLVTNLPNVLFKVGNFELTKDLYLLLLFAFLMVFASVLMIKKTNTLIEKNEFYFQRNKRLIFIISGLLVGCITGLVGAGGGFLIIPVLFLIGKLPMRRAVGTSLLIITLNSLVGFASNFQLGISIDWQFLITFTAFTIVGVLFGIYLGKKINGQRLKRAFGWFVLVLGIYIIISSLFSNFIKI